MRVPRERIRSINGLNLKFTMRALLIVLLWKSFDFGCNKPANMVDVEPEFLDLASEISSNFGFVTLVYTNTAYVEMTKSFVCNILALEEDQIDQFLFVSSSQAATDELTAFNDRLQVVTVHTNSKAANFGTFEYYSITLDRLELQNNLLQRGLNVFVVEADATWFSVHVFKSVILRLKEFDFVTADDNFNDGDYSLVSAGFLACRSTNRTRIFFADYVADYRSKLLPLRHHRGKLSLPGEQVHMTFRLRESNLTVSWLDVCEFSSGKWYSSAKLREKCPTPMVLQNNWIVGNKEKMKRARNWGHWFLDATCSCSTNSVWLNQAQLE